MRRHVIRSPQAPETAGASQAISVEVRRLTFVSGQLPVDTAGRILVGGLQEQVTLVMQNLRYVLEAGGLSLDSLEQVTLYLLDLQDLTAVDEVYRAAFLRPPPARSVVQVAGLPEGARVMISAIAGA